MKLLSLAFGRQQRRAASDRYELLVEALVVPEADRCVQCGICSYSCPIGIDVRRHAWTGVAVRDSHCLSCGECIARCPRGVLRFERCDTYHPDAERPPSPSTST